MRRILEEDGGMLTFDSKGFGRVLAATGATALNINGVGVLVQSEPPASCELLAGSAELAVALFQNLAALDKEPTP
jgi:hypothetical protein